MSLYRKEIIFIRCLLCAFALEGMREINIKGDEFEEKINKIEFFFGDKKYEFNIIFIKEPITGIRQRLQEALKREFNILFYVTSREPNNIIIDVTIEKARSIINKESKEIGLNLEILRQTIKN